jgi:hypothetical protein
MDLALGPTDEQACKSELTELSRRLRNMVRDMKSLCETQPDYPSRMKKIQGELNVVIGRLRQING